MGEWGAPDQEAWRGATPRGYTDKRQNDKRQKGQTSEATNVRKDKRQKRQTSETTNVRRDKRQKDKRRKNVGKNVRKTSENHNIIYTINILIFHGLVIAIYCYLYHGEVRLGH